MVESNISDLISLDRDVARAVAQVEQWRSGLNEDPEGRAEEDPFEGVRRASAKSTRDALLAYDVGVVQRPLRDALARWVSALVETRIGVPGEVELAVQANAACARFEGTEPRRVSWREAWRGLLSARTISEGQLWLDAASEAAPRIAHVRRDRASRRGEAARRLGAQDPWELFFPAPLESLRSCARRVLDVTDPVAEALRKEGPLGDRGPAATILDALARGAGDGWPSRLSPSWLQRTFAGLARDLPLRLGPLPPALGAASFARALYAFGFALRIASTDLSTSFAIAREPAFVAAHRWGFLFASLAADPDFQQRVLGIGRRTAAAQGRMLARTALFDARLHAARIVLSGSDEPPVDSFDEVGTRLFGRSLDGRLRGAWPWARDDEPARFVALLQAPGARSALVDRFDVDWYRNPRAWVHLREQGALPAWEPVDEKSLDAATNALARAFEETLG